MMSVWLLNILPKPAEMKPLSPLLSALISLLQSSSSPPDEWLENKTSRACYRHTNDRWRAVSLRSSCWQAWSGDRLWSFRGFSPLHVEPGRIEALEDSERFFFFLSLLWSGWDYSVLSFFFLILTVREISYPSTMEQEEDGEILQGQSSFWGKWDLTET